MSVFPILLVTWVGTSAGFVSPQAAHTVLQRASQQSAWGSSRRAAHSSNARGRADQPVSLFARRAGWALLAACSLDRTAARIRRLRTAEGVKMDVVEAFTVCEEELDAAASAYAEPSGARAGT